MVSALNIDGLLKKKYILIGIGALVVGFFLLKPDIPIGWYKDLKKKFETEDVNLKKQIDSIQELRKTEKENLTLALEQKDSQLMAISQELEIARQRIKVYDKELSNYRNAGFDERFELFTGLVSGKDSLSGD